MGSPTVLVVLAAGFEEIEAVTPVDLLRRAGAEVTLASLDAEPRVAGRSGLVLVADTTFAAALPGLFDCLLLPGGPGVSLLRADPRVASRIRVQEEQGGWIAAICAAPVVLKDAGVLVGRRHTAHTSVRGELKEAQGDLRAVADGKVVTSRGAGTALDFGLLLVEKLFSADKAAEIARSICA
jgi:4-methyl-5(b-hydroxyethyl)-thiazole monophosphate biosynthesis